MNNQSERLGTYTEMVGLRRFVWHGDVTTSERRQFLRDPTDVLMTTPESLEVMLVSQNVDARAVLGNVGVIVIDEVHAIAGTDRGAHLMSVIERIAALGQLDVQRIGLSATVGNPAELLTWLQGSSARPGVVVDPPRLSAKRELLVVHREDLTDGQRSDRERHRSEMDVAAVRPIGVLSAGVPMGQRRPVLGVRRARPGRSRRIDSPRRGGSRRRHRAGRDRNGYIGPGHGWRDPCGA